MAEIFLSYKKEDRAVAERLVTALRAAGQSVWWDDALNPGQAWDAMIEREIAASRHVIVLWTPRSVGSDWVRSEAHYAQDHGKLVPVMIERCELPIAFMLRQAVDLSTGVFDASNPQWQRLLGWIEGEAAHDPAHAAPGDSGTTLPPAAAALAAVPVKALSGERWLGPAKRPTLAIGLGVLALLLVGLFMLRGSLGWGKSIQPDVVVDPFAVHAAGLPAGFADSLSNEMFNGFSTSSRISPVNGDGKRRPHAYQLTGDISTEGDKILVIAKLFVPDAEAAVTTIKFDQPRSNPIAARLFGLELAEFTRCVATASDSNGSKLVVLPPEAIAPWARFCQQINRGTDEVSAAAIVATLRSVVAAAPDFANGWSNLADFLSAAALNPGGDRAALLAETAKAADRALALDPTTAKAYSVQSWLALGMYGDPRTADMTPTFHDFDTADQLARKSTSVRPSDCGCELPSYSYLLTVLGRTTASLPPAQQAVSNDSSQVGHAVALAGQMIASNNPAEGLKLLDDLAAKWPGDKYIASARFQFALWRRDWAAARAALPDQPDGPAKAAWPALLDALAAGNAARAHAAAAPFVAIAADPHKVSGPLLSALSLGGYPDQAVDALAAGLQVQGVNLMAAAFRPSFAEARKSGKFAALARRVGLVDYWKTPGHRPDFCGEPSPAAICASLAKN